MLSKELHKKFTQERNFGDKSVPLFKQVKNLEASGTFQKLAGEDVEHTPRGLATKLVAEENKTSVANVWVSLSKN